jgi:hypothetical protein
MPLKEQRKNGKNNSGRYNLNIGFTRYCKMVEVIILPSLEEEINNKFGSKSVEVLELLRSLKDSPYKGKPLATVGNILIKEIRYESFRFYFITNGYILKIMDQSKLEELLIKFVRMSNKKQQQSTIDEIKNILRKLGEDGF